jgi:hypothetical protein
MTETETAEGYRAWWRPWPGARWQEIGRGSQAIGCWDAAVWTLAQRRGGDCVVLPADRHPDDPAPGDGRARYRRGRSLELTPPAPTPSVETGR